MHSRSALFICTTGRMSALIAFFRLFIAYSDRIFTEKSPFSPNFPLLKRLFIIHGQIDPKIFGSYILRSLLVFCLHFLKTFLISYFSQPFDLQDVFNWGKYSPFFYARARKNASFFEHHPFQCAADFRNNFLGCFSLRKWLRKWPPFPPVCFFFTIVSVYFR